MNKQLELWTISLEALINNTEVYELDHVIETHILDRPWFEQLTFMVYMNNNYKGVLPQIKSFREWSVKNKSKLLGRGKGCKETNNLINKIGLQFRRARRSQHIPKIVRYERI